MRVYLVCMVCVCVYFVFVVYVCSLSGGVHFMCVYLFMYASVYCMCVRYLCKKLRLCMYFVFVFVYFICVYFLCTFCVFMSVGVSVLFVCI